MFECHINFCVIQEIILKEKEALIDAFNKATPASVPASLYWQTLNDRYMLFYCVCEEFC